MNNKLEERIIVFLEDLRTFNESILLANYVDSSFMSPSYFTSNEIKELKSIKLDGISLELALDELFKSKEKNKGELCSSHDLYPLYIRYFDIKRRSLSKSNIKSYRKQWRKWYINNEK